MIDKKRTRRYCYEPEMIENYERAIADKNETWDCHHRLETIMNCGLKELKAQGCYYHRPAHELIFLRHEDHIRLHKKGENNTQFGKHQSEERRKKVSKALKGRIPWNKGLVQKNLTWLIAWVVCFLAEPLKQDFQPQSK